MGRNAVASDLNPVAFCLTRAKTNAPAIATVRHRLTALERHFAPPKESQCQELGAFFRLAYSRQTLGQLLYLRDHLKWRESRVDCFVAALILGSLHGQRSPSYFSNQMPRTISTKPRYSVKFWRLRGLRPPIRDVFEVLRRQLTYRYETPPPPGRAAVWQMDMRELPRLQAKFPRCSCVITSPPYFDVTRFEEDQWLRLWFLGGPPKPTYRQVSRDDRHSSLTAYWRMITDMWRTLGLVLAPRAEVVIRLGGRASVTEHLVNALTGSAAVSRRRVKLVSCEVSEIRKRQTGAFRPGSKGCLREVDCHFSLS